MANEYTPDLITLIGDDGKEIEFEILVIILNFGKLFFAVNFGNFKNIIFSRIIYSILGIFKERVEYIKLTLIVFNDIKNFKFYFFTVITDKGNDSGEYYIFEVTEIDGEEELAEIEDDDKLDRIAAVFEERYNEEFYDEDD